MSFHWEDFFTSLSSFNCKAPCQWKWLRKITYKSKSGHLWSVHKLICVSFFCLLWDLHCNEKRDTHSGVVFFESSTTSLITATSVCPTRFQKKLKEVVRLYTFQSAISDERLRWFEKKKKNCYLLLSCLERRSRTMLWTLHWETRKEATCIRTLYRCLNVHVMTTGCVCEYLQTLKL